MVVGGLRARGTELVGELVRYKDSYQLCYVCGPEGVIVELAERIGGIVGVFGTDAGINLAGKAKADRLVAAFGEKGYDYIGDMPIDFDVWRSARNVRKCYTS